MVLQYIIHLNEGLEKFVIRKPFGIKNQRGIKNRYLLISRKVHGSSNRCHFQKSMAGTINNELTIVTVG